MGGFTVQYADSLVVCACVYDTVYYIAHLYGPAAFSNDCPMILAIIATPLIGCVIIQVTLCLVKRMVPS